MSSAALFSQTVYVGGQIDGNWGAMHQMSTQTVNSSSFFYCTIQATGTYSPSTWLFEADSYYNKWNGVTAAKNTVSTFTWNANYSGSDNSLTGGVTSGKYYTYRLKNNGYASALGVVMETSAAPVTINATTLPTQPISNNDDITITVYLSGSKSTEENVYLRYSIDNGSTWTNSSAITFSGSSGTVTIPRQAKGTTVKYFVFSTTLSSPTSNIELSSLSYKDSSGSYYSYTVNYYGSKADGNWSSTATWENTTVPTSAFDVLIKNSVTVDATAVANSVTIKSGGTLTSKSSSAVNLTITSGGSLTNNGTFTANDGTVTFAGSGTVSGTVAFYNVYASGGVNFGSSSTINGTLKINAGGYVNTNAPTYGTGSTLQYNAGGSPYGRYAEWASTSGVGYPYNVQISNNTEVVLGANGGTTTSRQIAGSLTVDSGSKLKLDSVGTANFAMKNALTVLGNVSINGVLALSDSSGGDLKTYGDVSFGNSSTFTPNKRAIFFLKNGTQTVVQASGSITIPYVIIGSGSGNTVLQLVSTNLVASADNGGNAISFTSSGDILDLNGKDLTIGTAGAAVNASGSGSIKGNTNSRVTILGTGALGTLNFTSGYQMLKYLSVNRTSSGSVTLGTPLTISDTLAIASGDLNTGSNIITLGSSALLSEAAGNMVTGNITTTRSVAKSANNTFGGIGVEINAAGAAPGSTSVTRVTGTALSGSGNVSIKRYYDITPATNTGLNATLVFHYDDRTAELNSRTESKLLLFKSTNSGSTWTLGAGTVNATSNTITLNGISDFSRWTAGASDAELPVELNTFNSSVKDRNVNLDWTTATEVNSSKFVVERSKIGTDTWTTLGEVNASNYSNAPKSYSFVDKNLNIGIYNYRLKMIDNDGTYEYSTIYAQATISVPAEFSLLQNYPNPFNPSTKITYALPVDSHVTLELYAITGQKVATIFNGTAESGYHDQSVDMTAYGLSSGVYIYRFMGKELGTGKQFSSVKKMMFLK
jgi:hypothetical protein